jgi:hypothetical protein
LEIVPSLRRTGVHIWSRVVFFNNRSESSRLAIRPAALAIPCPIYF